MTNIDNAAGGRIKGAIISANFNELIHEYVIPASDSDEFFTNDFVKTNATSDEGTPICVKATAGDPIRGIVVAFKANHIYENTVYREANTKRIVYICDDPKVEFEIQATGILTSTDIGKNAEIVVAAGIPAIGLSGTQLDSSTLTTVNAQLKLLRIVDDPINELGQYTKTRCIIYEHELNGSSGASTLKHNDLLNLTYDTAGHGTNYTGFQRGTTLSGSNPTVNSDDTAGYVQGDLWLNTATKTLFYCIENTTGAAIWDGIEAGIHWQQSVKDQVNFVTSEPAAPTIDDRYINTTTGVSSITGQSVTATYIYEWNGTTWSETIPQEGYALWDETANEYFIFNGSAWVALAATQSFLQLSDTPVSYATAHAVYKVNAAQTAVAESSMTCDDSGNVNVPGKLTVVGAIDPTGLILDPQGSPPSTDDGTIYYDSGSDKFLFREDGAWQELAAVSIKEDIPISSDGQTAFTLSEAVSNPESARLYLNHAVYEKVGIDFNVSGTSLTWLDPDGVTLETTDQFTIMHSDGSIGSAPVQSVFGRVGTVVAAGSDYDASQVDNDSVVSGAFVSDALDTLDGLIGASKTVFLPAMDYNANSANYRMRSVGASANFNFTFYLPNDLASIVSFKAIGIPTAGAAQAARDIDLSSEYGTIGEASNFHNETDTGTLYDLSGTSGELTEIVDLTVVLSAAVAGDYMGINISQTSLGGSIVYIGFKLIYNT